MQAIACRDEATRCISGRREVCIDSQWQRLPCDDGEICTNDGECVFQPQMCLNGETRCQAVARGEIERQICQNGEWQTEDCPIGQFCDEGECVRPAVMCLNGMRRCSPDDAGSFQECVNGRWSVPVACGQGSNCVDGQCVGDVPAACNEGDRRCSDPGNNVEECRGGGNWMLVEECRTGCGIPRGRGTEAQCTCAARVGECSRGQNGIVARNCVLNFWRETECNQTQECAVVDNRAQCRQRR